MSAVIKIFVREKNVYRGFARRALILSIVAFKTV